MRVVVDQRRNSLRLLIPAEGEGSDPGTAGTEDATGTTSHPATLDVGEGGRLLGLEVASGSESASPATEPWYLELEAAPGQHLRSVPVTVDVGRGQDGEPVWVDLPRRGAGYELTFPSGNQCWVRPRRRLS
jgi:hypothetical protein